MATERQQAIAGGLMHTDRSRRTPLAAIARTCLLSAATIAFTLGPLSAQETPDAVPRVDSLFARFDDPNSPGCLLGVIREGGFIYTRGYGMASLEDRVPLSPETPIYVASLVKQFVAATVLIAAEQGFLHLDDDVREYLPELPEYGRPITIRHLVHHTSGIRDMYTLRWIPSMEWAGAPDDREALSLLARQRELNFASGDAVAYTTSNYELLSHIIERATGSPLWKFANSVLFQPLGMNQTQIHHGPAPGATGYVPTEAGEFEAAADTAQRRGAYTTLGDLLVWDRNLYESAIGGEGFADRLVTPGRLADGEPHHYAFGLAVGEYGGLRTLAHGGAFTGFRSAYLRFPDQEFSVLCLCNTNAVVVEAVASRVADIYLADDLDTDPPQKADVEIEELERLTGSYINPAGRTLEVEVVDGSLAFVGPNRTNRLTALSNTRFVSPSFFNNQYEFGRETADHPWSFVVTPNIAGLMPNRRFLFRAVEAVDPSSEHLGQYGGVYANDEVPAVYRIVLEEGELRLDRGSELSKLTLRPAAADTFVQPDKGVTLRFSRDGRDRVAGLYLEAAGVWSLRFTKRR